MIYDTNEVESVLICTSCEGKLDLPKCLPCGEAICSHCESLIQVNANKFECVLCKDEHEMPRLGLPINKPLLKMLSFKQTEVSRGIAYDLLKNKLNEIKIKREFIKNGIENGDDLVKEHFMDLKSEVQLATEEAILQINDISTKIVEELDEYEKELLEYNKTNRISLDIFNEILKELERFYTSNTEYLKSYVVDDELVVKSNDEATSLIKRAELEIEKLKSIIFNGKLSTFRKKNQKLDRSILGITLLVNIEIDSNILSDRDQIHNLISLCEFSIDQKWNLIYRASRDGFEGADFHAKCDDKPNTFILIKSEYGNVFGGYTEQSWSGTGHKKDQNAFLFSLINKLGRQLKIKWSGKETIGRKDTLGPIFGGPGFYDLIIRSKTNCSSDLGYSFIHPDYALGTNEAKTLLAGSDHFQVSEIEVYTTQ